MSGRLRIRGRLCLMLAACSLIATPAEAATKWDRVQTGGGCYTPTVVFSEVQQGLAYARTDVAGAYRWDNATSHWVSLLDSTGWTETHLSGVLSVAASPQNTNKAALACGLYTNGWDPLNGVILTLRTIPIPTANCAPQVFYFRPQKKWYLIFQSQHPRFSTSHNSADPMPRSGMGVSTHCAMTAKLPSVSCRKS